MEIIAGNRELRTIYSKDLGRPQAGHEYIRCLTKQELEITGFSTGTLVGIDYDGTTVLFFRDAKGAGVMPAGQPNNDYGINAYWDSLESQQTE